MNWQEPDPANWEKVIARRRVVYIVEWFNEGSDRPVAVWYDDGVEAHKYADVVRAAGLEPVVHIAVRVRPEPLVE